MTSLINGIAIESSSSCEPEQLSTCLYCSLEPPPASTALLGWLVVLSPGRQSATPRQSSHRTLTTLCNVLQTEQLFQTFTSWIAD